MGGSISSPMVKRTESQSLTKYSVQRAIKIEILVRCGSEWINYKFMDAKIVKFLEKEGKIKIN